MITALCGRVFFGGEGLDDGVLRSKIWLCHVTDGMQHSHYGWSQTTSGWKRWLWYASHRVS